MPELNFEQNINTELQMLLSPRLLGMLRILNLPYTDLVKEIESASEENPMLEIESHERLTEYLRYLESNKKTKKELDFKEYPGLENIKEAKRDLRSHLLTQLSLADVPQDVIEAAEALISEIDGNGYLKNYEEIKQRTIKKNKTSDAVAEKALDLIQSFEPEGVGARTLEECLLIQVKEYGFDSPALQRLLEKTVKNHLADLGKKDFKKISAALNITDEGALEIAEYIRLNLNPYPGAAFGEEAQHVIPSFAVEKEDDKYKIINLEEKYGPKIGLSREYQKMLKDPKTDEKTVKFLKERYEKATEMLEDLAKRKETSSAIMEIIMEMQTEFLEKGAAWLAPLEQKGIAERLGLHPSTISRAVAGKYIQTPQGMLPFKFLCPRKYKGVAPSAVKAKILEMVADEDKKDPLSDDDIKNVLAKEGITVERRTVAGYRKALGILPSGERSVL